MKRFTRVPYLLLSVAAVLVALAASPLVHAGPAAPTVPVEIDVRDGHKPYLVAHAVGVQIYRCDLTSSGYRWNLAAPRADLFGHNGQLIGTHFGGPTWLATDGSKVVGTVEVRATVDTSAIQWLRLAAASTSAGADGDRFAGTTYIQRIATVGGLAPVAGCDAGAVGDTTEIPYTADYVFWKASPADPKGASNQ